MQECVCGGTSGPLLAGTPCPLRPCRRLPTWEQCARVSPTVPRWGGAAGPGLWGRHPLLPTVTLRPQGHHLRVPQGPQLCLPGAGIHDPAREAQGYHGLWGDGEEEAPHRVVVVGTRRPWELAKERGKKPNRTCSPAFLQRVTNDLSW